MKKYTVEKMSSTRELITFKELNSKGEKIQVEIASCESEGKPGSLPYLWKKNGFTKFILKNWLSISTYATEDGGNGACWGRYNPQHRLSDDGKRLVINFDWVLAATEGNREKIIAEVERLAFN